MACGPPAAAGSRGRGLRARSPLTACAGRRLAARLRPVVCAPVRENCPAPAGKLLPCAPPVPAAPAGGSGEAPGLFQGACGPPCCSAARLPRGLAAPSFSQSTLLGPCPETPALQRFFYGKLSGNCQLIFSRRFRQAHFSLLISKKSGVEPRSYLLRRNRAPPAMAPSTTLTQQNLCHFVAFVWFKNK